MACLSNLSSLDWTCNREKEIAYCTRNEVDTGRTTKHGETRTMHSGNTQPEQYEKLDLNIRWLSSHIHNQHYTLITNECRFFLQRVCSSCCYGAYSLAIDSAVVCLLTQY